jgi:hypothetical protein
MTPIPPLSDFSGHLLTLNNGRPGLRGTLQIDVRESEPSTPDTRPSSCLDFVSSDETLDRYGEIISAAGWRLDNYRRNPVFQNAHQYGDVIFTLGRALITEVREVGPAEVGRASSQAVLFQRIQFATDVNPMARIAYGLYKGKFLNAVSVGFIPLRWKDGPNERSLSAGGESRGDVVSSLSTLNYQPSTRSAPRRQYLEQELLEVSAVGIPANPNALALGLKSGAVEKSDLKELHELIRQTMGTSKEVWEPVPIKTKRPDDLSELLRLAKEVREILRA